jgi:hypothetical protein
VRTTFSVSKDAAASSKSHNNLPVKGLTSWAGKGAFESKSMVFMIAAFEFPLTMKQMLLA